MEVVQEETAGVQFDGKFYVSKSNQDKSQQLFKDWHVKQAEEKIIPKAKFHAKNLGVKYNAIKILDLK